jgi:hypothetical protein
MAKQDAVSVLLVRRGKGIVRLGDRVTANGLRGFGAREIVVKRGRARANLGKGTGLRERRARESAGNVIVVRESVNSGFCGPLFAGRVVLRG